MEFNLADLFECVADHVAEREAVVAGDRRLTYGQLDERATQLAHGLADRGVATGEHVGLHLRNCVEHVEALLACFKLRAVPVNLNWRYTSTELTHLLADAAPVAVISHPDLRQEVLEAARAVPSLRLHVEVGGTAEPATQGAAPRPLSYEELVASGSAERDLGPRSADDHYVLYTGGTTGLPKGVVWRQEDIFFAVLGGGNPGGPPIDAPHEIGANVVDNPAQRLRPFLPPDDPGPDQLVQLALGPLMHAGGQWSALGTLLGGGRVVLYDHEHVDMRLVLGLVERERVVSLNLVGDVSARPLLHELEASPDLYDTLSVRLVGSGASALSAEVKGRLFEAFPNALAITEAVGSSEAPVEAVSVTLRDGPVPPSLRFEAREGVTAVLDDDLRPVEAGSGAVGRLATRGRVPLGYHRDPEATASTFVTRGGQRWTVTGDMASVEADGSIRLLGRGATCINSGGEKVYPEEVEAVLSSHPRVADVLVVGAPDERLGETVVALVAARDASDPPELDDLQAHCRGELAGYKVPRDLIVVGEVARSPAGKPDYEWARGLIASRFSATGR